jgi:hypothetical protein
MRFSVDIFLPLLTGSPAHRVYQKIPLRGAVQYSLRAHLFNLLMPRICDMSPFRFDLESCRTGFARCGVFPMNGKYVVNGAIDCELTIGRDRSIVQQAGNTVL